MRIPLLIVSATLALSGCASTGGGKLAVCDGKHLRPANPYGSVLAVSGAGGTSPPTSPPAESKPKTLSSNAASTSFGSCLA